MIKINIVILKIITLLVVATYALHARAELRDLPNVNILAASSLTDPITEIVRIYSREKNITVTASYSATSEQAWKIEEGDSADLFISSHPFWMAELKQMGLIDVYSLTNLVKNKLAIVTSTKSRLNKNPIIAQGTGGKINHLNNRAILVFGDPNNTALGLYTKQSIQAIDKQQKSNLWDKLENRFIRAANSKNALYLITHGETGGITYYSDAYNNPEVDILSIVDEKLHEPIIYQAAVVAGENMSHARDFMQFLMSPDAKKIFKKHGFIID